MLSPGSSAARIELIPGTVLDGRFRLLHAIGRGGFGEVWRASELLPNGTAIRDVALKILSPESDPALWSEEAKLLASFSHASLVTILAAGFVTLDAQSSLRAPFVAMELLEGETLGALLAKQGRIPWRRVLAWARDVAAALDVIHSRGVIHLDLKPSNLFLTSSGALKVLDFGIARQAGSRAEISAKSKPLLPAQDDALGTAEFLAEHGRQEDAVAIDPSVPSRTPKTIRVVGTPGFIAPEVIEQRPATCAADAYALAACMVQLATGKPPQDVADSPKTQSSDALQAYWAEIRLATSTGRLRDLENPKLGLPKGMAALCKRLLSLEPDARDIRPGALRALIEDAWERPFGVPDPPYRGLSAFGPEAEGMLFGRDDDIARLLRELSEHSVLVLQGISGSGKSSLAMAGLAQALAKRDAASGPDWQTLTIRPGTDPDAALSAGLSGIAPELAKMDVGAIAAYCEEKGIGLLLIFDQLEELVTQASEGNRRRFVEILAKMAELPPAAKLRAIGTLREDFTSGLLAIEPLGDALRDSLRFVGPPTAAAVREIVGAPARLSGVKVEGLSEVAADVQKELRSADGRLPLVALALSAWWGTRKRGEGGEEVLYAADWKALGGVQKIFADIADGVYSALDPAAQAAARAVFLEISGDGRTRRRIEWSALHAMAKDGAAFERAVAAFVGAGLWVEKGGAVEVVHEALLTSWERLSGWIADAQARRRISAALVAGARAWQDLGRPATRLPGPSEAALSELSLIEGGLHGDDAELVRNWLLSARKRTRRMRIQTAISGLLVLVLVAFGFGIWGLTVSEAQRKADEAKLEANRASEMARENEKRAVDAADAANKAKEDADKAKAQREQAEVKANRQVEIFNKMLREAKDKTEEMKVRCNMLTTMQRVRNSGGCPPGDTLCSGGME